MNAKKKREKYKVNIVVGKSIIVKLLKMLHIQCDLYAKYKKTIKNRKLYTILKMVPLIC